MKDTIKAAVYGIAIKTVGPALAIIAALIGYIGISLVSKNLSLYPRSATF
jgi:hypothetical protein